ncbi:SUN domain-containing protein 1 [Marmota monax]|uniref:SUN domain-containing protein 1 n=1 Tax=Marmota monax TaxID=9995 RepID=A0A834V4Y6_MARMO|nr:SUN domain-containing protein 1 [Marmota monax]
MDFSRLHTYTPPQCVPENTGYTYALSSSYSSDALDFEIEHKLDPVFDSPRMSRRSLRLVTTTYSSGDGQAVDLHSCTSRAASLQGGAARTAKQRRSASKPAFSINHLSGKATSSGASQGSSHNLRSTTAPRPPVLDESLIREQTKVDHFWGLDDDGDLKGGTKAATQGNGDLATDATTHNGYICRDCSMLSQRTEALTAHPASQGPSSRVYSRDRNPKRDDCKGKKHLETHTAAHLQLSRPRRVAGAVGRLFTHAGHFLVQMLRRVGAAGWLVSETVRSVLWLAVVAPGKAASRMLWWLGIGWYQFVTLISWLNVFLLTRCLRNICKFLILLIPLLLLLGAGISLWGQGDFLSLLPILNWTNVHSAHRASDPKDMFRPGASYLNQPLQADDRASQWHQESDMGHQVASLTAQCHNHDQKLKELTVLLQKLQVRVNQMDDGREGLSSWVKDTVRQHLQEMGLAGLPSTETNIMTFNHDHEVRLSNLEDILGKLRETSEAIQKELEQIKQRTISGAEEQPLLPRIQRLELELGLLRTQLSDWQHQKASCEEVDTQVRETIKLLFSEDQQGGSLEWLLQKFSSQFVSKDDLQVLLQDLELQVLKNITHHITVTRQAPTSEAVVSAMSDAGVSGITEEVSSGETRFSLHLL